MRDICVFGRRLHSAASDESLRHVQIYQRRLSASCTYLLNITVDLYLTSLLHLPEYRLYQLFMLAALSWQRRFNWRIL